MDSPLKGMKANLVQIIETTLFVRGENGSEENPPRVIRQFWTIDGILIGEIDAVKNKQAESAPVS